MSAERAVFLTPQEYLAIERQAETKSEYYAGQMFAMAGASIDHVVITGNLVTALHTQLRGRPCYVLPQDLRVRVDATGLYTYPDIAIVCGEMRVADSHKDTLLNPTVLIEVLSPSTEGYDRGRKAEHYRKLESLQEYVLISQDRAHVESQYRTADGTWNISEVSSLDETLELRSIDCRLLLAEVYDRIELAETAA